MDKAMLSVVVISHNRKDELRRCLDSILSQETNFLVEVIVSDDRSTDGTREMLLSDYKDIVITTFFNSDEYETSYVLERAALNRINGLKHVSGKYLIHIDGDDFFTGTDLFQTMVDKLENHPECSLCCQNYTSKPYDSLEGANEPILPLELFGGNRILSGYDFIKEIGIVPNSCFCMRFSDNINICDLTSNSYDDIDITLRYLGLGKVVLVNKCDFVYVKYSDSSCSTVCKQEQLIMFQSQILDIPMVPYYAGVLLDNSLLSLIKVSLEILKSNSISSRLVNYCHKFNLIMYQNIRENMTLYEKRLYVNIILIALLAKMLPFLKKYLLKCLYKIAINKEITQSVVI